MNLEKITDADLLRAYLALKGEPFKGNENIQVVVDSLHEEERRNLDVDIKNEVEQRNLPTNIESAKRLCKEIDQFISVSKETPPK